MAAFLTKSFIKRGQVLRVLRAPLTNNKACCGGLNNLAAFNSKPSSSQSFRLFTHHHQSRSFTSSLSNGNNGTVNDDPISFRESGNASSSSTPMSEGEELWLNVDESLKPNLLQLARDEMFTQFEAILSDKAPREVAILYSQCRLQSQQKEKDIKFNFDDAASFWEQFEKYAIPETGRLCCPDIVLPLTFYRNCTSSEHYIPFQGRDAALEIFQNEIDRKIRISQKQLQPKNREPITATFGGPGSGKSRLIDQFAIDINDNYADSKEIFPICLNVTYNQRTVPYDKFDNNSNPRIAFSAFCWRILCNFCESVNEKVVIERIYENIANYKELTLDTTIKLILNHPSIENNIKRKIPLIYIAMDEILKINQKLDGYILDAKGNQIDFYNSYNIIREICYYYDDLYRESNNDLYTVPAIMFVISSLYRAGFKDGKTPSDRNIVNLPLHRLSIEQRLNMIEHVLGNEWRDHIFQNMYSVLVLCDGYPFLIDGVVEYIIQQISSENLTISSDLVRINSLKNKIFDAMILRAKERSHPSDYNVLFKEPNDFYRFLSYHNVLPIEDLTDTVIAQYKECDALNEILSSSHLEVADKQFVIPCFILYYIYKNNESFRQQQIFGDLFDLLGETTKIRMTERFLAVYEVFHSQIMSKRYGANMTLNEYFSNCTPLISEDFNIGFNQNKYDMSKICKFDPSVREVGYDKIKYDLDTIYCSNYDYGSPLFDYGSRIELTKRGKKKKKKKLWLFRQVTTDTNKSRATASKFNKLNEDICCYFLTHANKKKVYARSLKSKMPTNTVLLLPEELEKWIIPSFKFWWTKLEELPAK